MVSIIIPFYNCIEYTKACIESVKKHTNNYELILIDNGTIDQYTLILDNGNGKLMENAFVIVNKENLGFPAAINQGIREAKGDLICILNNDIIVTEDWMSRLVWHIENGLDIVGPCTNSISGPQQKIIDIYNNKDELNETANEFYEENKQQHTLFHRLVGFCLLFRKKVITKIGHFDEAFSPGNLEDDDFCLRAIGAGFKLGIAQDVFIHHYGSVTRDELNIDYEKLLRKNKQYFDSKWPDKIINQLIERNLNETRN